MQLWMVSRLDILYQLLAVQKLKDRLSQSGHRLDCLSY